MVIKLPQSLVRRAGKSDLAEFIGVPKDQLVSIPDKAYDETTAKETAKSIADASECKALLPELAKHSGVEPLSSLEKLFACCQRDNYSPCGYEFGNPLFKPLKGEVAKTKVLVDEDGHLYKSEAELKSDAKDWEMSLKEYKREFGVKTVEILYPKTLSKAKARNLIDNIMIFGDWG